MTDIIYGGNRDGSITKEEAIKRFNEYYEGRAKSSIGRFRAKLFDMMYQKKPSKTLEYGKPGSEKYLLEEGPRTFDILGVDSFDEDEEFVVHGESNTDKYKSKGSTYRKDNDSESSIYGPRLSGDDDQLYSSHFREVYKARKALNEGEKGSLKNDNLIDIYWKKYREGGIERKNKKTKKKVEKLLFGAFLSGSPKCIFNPENKEIFYNNDGSKLEDDDYDIQIEFLSRIGLIYNTEDEGFKLNKRVSKAKVLKIHVEVIDGEEDLFYRISDGRAVNIDCDAETMDFHDLFNKLDYELVDITDAIPHSCNQDESLLRTDSDSSYSDEEEPVEFKSSNVFGEQDIKNPSYHSQEDDEGEESDLDEEESDLDEEDDEGEESDLDEEDDEGEESDIDEEDDDKLELGDLGEELAFLSSDDEDDDEEDTSSIISQERAEVFGNLPKSIQNLEGMEEAMKGLEL